MPKPKQAVIEYRNYDLPLQFPVLLLTGEHWKISDIPSGRLHFHNCLEIGICHSDSGTLEFPGHPYPFRENDITVIPRNIPHTTYSSPGTKSLWSYLFIDPQPLFTHVLPVTWENWNLSVLNFGSYHFILSQSEYPAVHTLMTAVIQELSEQKPGYQYSTRGLLLALYIELYRAQFGTPRAEDHASHSGSFAPSVPDNSLVITPALEFIEDHYMQQFNIDYLAELCHWSPTHFRRVFQKIMGTSPLDFVNTKRIVAACDLLRTTEESILNISEAVGFHSISSFNRSFLKIMQASPREYRKTMTDSAKREEVRSIQEFAGWMYPEY